MISLAKLREGLNIPAGDDYLLADLRSQVILQWEEATGFLWDSKAAHVEIFRLTQDPRPYTLFLELIPVITVTKVEERSASGSSAWVVTDTANYDLLGRRSLENYAGRWSALVRVTYDGGATSAPADIQRALIIQAQFLKSRLDSEKISLRSQNFEGGAGVFEDAFLHPFFKQLAKSKQKSLI